MRPAVRALPCALVALCLPGPACRAGVVTFQAVIEFGSFNVETFFGPGPDGGHATFSGRLDGLLAAVTLDFADADSTRLRLVALAYPKPLMLSPANIQLSLFAPPTYFQPFRTDLADAGGGWASVDVDLSGDAITHVLGAAPWATPAHDSVDFSRFALQRASHYNMREAFPVAALGGISWVAVAVPGPGGLPLALSGSLLLLLAARRVGARHTSPG